MGQASGTYFSQQCSFGLYTGTTSSDGQFNNQIFTRDIWIAYKVFFQQNLRILLLMRPIVNEARERDALTVQGRQSRKTHFDGRSRRCYYGGGRGGGHFGKKIW